MTYDYYRFCSYICMERSYMLPSLPTDYRGQDLYQAAWTYLTQNYNDSP